ncbi:MAG TPA: DUF6600 domain-containing protein, partial [Verrucomicrobiae bacterium]|nr:DUF6600 domain-containing protein [Verrucomicrobiae bacterium]
MRMRLCAVIVACQIAGLWLPGSARAAVNFQFSAGLQIGSPSDFYQPLDAYGEWITLPSYGRCWHPVDVVQDWRPYSVGYWEWTDCGWYWVSDEPWAWACYHYGGWEFDPTYGWVWIPGTEWAPAWVTWREGPDYIGWAPCGPGGVSLGASFFAFVDIHHFHDHLRPRDFIVHNTRIIDRTRVISNNHVRERRSIGGRQEQVIVNRGPS